MRSSSLVLLVALALAPVAMSVCPPGWSNKAVARNYKCRYGHVSLCLVTGCCEMMTGKCRFARDTFSCQTDFYKDRSKYGADAGSDTASKQAACCTAKATCSQATCPAGYTANAGAASTKCTSSVSTCSLSTCCTADATKCASWTGSCAADYFRDTSKNGAAKGADTASAQAACCTAKISCSGSTCPAGYTTKASAANTKCAGGTGSSCTTSLCCTIDNTKCSSWLGNCPTGKYHPFTSTAGNAKGSTTASAQQACCVNKATCGQFWTYTGGSTSSVAAVRPTMMVVALFAIVSMLASMF